MTEILDTLVVLRLKFFVSFFRFQDDLVAWLCEEMVRDDSAVDQLDMSGNSALHLAAKQGKLSTISVLLHHGAQIDTKVSQNMRS